jgi:hypothetical protein
MFTEISEYDKALMTAENCGDAYRALNLPASGPECRYAARAILVRELKKQHPRLSITDRTKVEDQVISRWADDAQEYRASITASNHAPAYRMMDFTGKDNDDAQTELLLVLCKHHASLRNDQMVTVARQVIAQWIADYSS